MKHPRRLFPSPISTCIRLFFCFPRNSMTMLCDSIMSWEIKISLEAYLPWLCAASCRRPGLLRFVLLRNAEAYTFVLSFYSLWIHLEWAFYGSQHSSVCWNHKKWIRKNAPEKGRRRAKAPRLWYSVHLLVERRLKNYSRKWIRFWRWPFVELLRGRTACWVLRRQMRAKYQLWMRGWTSAHRLLRAGSCRRRFARAFIVDSSKLVVCEWVSLNFHPIKLVETFIMWDEVWSRLREPVILHIWHAKLVHKRATFDY